CEDMPACCLIKDDRSAATHGGIGRHSRNCESALRIVGIHHVEPDRMIYSRGGFLAGNVGNCWWKVLFAGLELKPDFTDLEGAGLALIGDEELPCAVRIRVQKVRQSEIVTGEGA